MKSHLLDNALRSYLESGALQALLPHRADLDGLPPDEPDALRRMAGAELSLWMLEPDRAAAHLAPFVEVRSGQVVAKSPAPSSSNSAPDWLLGALFTTAAQLQYRYHRHYGNGLRLCDLADRYFARDRRSSWFWLQKNQVTRCRLLYRDGEHDQATRILAETDQTIRQMHASTQGHSSEAIDVLLGITNEIRASIAATAGDLPTARVLIMESLVSLAERDPVRHAYAYLSASRIYAALGGEHSRMASRYAGLAIEEFAEYGHAFEGRARNQRARCLVPLGQFQEAEEELELASTAIAQIDNVAERAFATADRHLTEARLEQARARAAKTENTERLCWARVEEATRSALALEPVPDRIRADAQIRGAQAVLKLRPKSTRAIDTLEAGIALAARADRVRIVAMGHLVLAEHFHQQRDSLAALTQLELAQEVVGSSSSEAIDRWANRLAGWIDQPVRIEVRGRKYKEVMSDFQTRLKDYYVGISNGSEERFRERSGLGRSEFFRSSQRGK